MPSLPALNSDIPYLQANDRHQVILCVDRATSTTTAEFRYWYADSPSWENDLATDTNIPVYYSLDESSYYTPGMVELPFYSIREGFEGIADRVLVEFVPHPAAAETSISGATSIGFSGRVEIGGLPGYSRVTTNTLTTGILVSDTFSYSSTVQEQASDTWPNVRTVSLPVRVGKFRKARVILTDIHLCKILRVKLLGKTVPLRGA